MVATARQRAQGAVRWSFVAAPIVALVLLAWSRRWMSDDGFINLRVVEQLLAGNGPVFNAGERVEIATSPLWVALLAMADAVTPWVPLAWIAVVLGITATALGVLAAQLGALRLRGHDPLAGPAVPLGALVVLALPPFWDFASSGLETGLSIAWLGGCWLLLAGEGSSRHWATPVVCGLGPLVRPDLAIFSVAFLAAVLLVLRPRPVRSRLAALGIAAVLPALWQFFRMGYYGALVPNTAFAKEASLARWDQGWRYLSDFTTPYALAIPLVVLLVLAVVPGTVRFLRLGERSRIWIFLAPVVAAIVHWLYVVRVGGDFMHARLLLPGLFAFVLPVAAVPLPALTSGRRAAAAVPSALAAIVAVWALVVAMTVRASYDGIGADGITDERANYAERAARAHPVTLDDHERNRWVSFARTAARQVPGDRRVLIVGEAGFRSPGHWVEVRPGEPETVVAFPSVGLLGYGAGTAVHVVDQLGLGDVVGARHRLEVRRRPGHEKFLDPAWIFARFADVSEPLPPGAPLPAAISAARRVLRCGDMAEVIAAAREPLTAQRFLANLGVAVRLHGARWSADPAVAERQLCPPAPSPAGVSY
jgi:arabinofuranosyltransferase